MAMRLVPTCMPAITFPEHNTLLTGLYPNKHGIIGNGFYNYRTGKVTSIYEHTLMVSENFHADPLWNTVQDSNLKSAVCRWPGSEVLIKGRKPNIVHVFQSDQELECRDKGLEWLEMGLDRTELTMLYFESGGSIRTCLWPGFG